jgi:hypothetical protein
VKETRFFLASSITKRSGVEGRKLERDRQQPTKFALTESSLDHRPRSQHSDLPAPLPTRSLPVLLDNAAITITASLAAKAHTMDRFPDGPLGIDLFDISQDFDFSQHPLVDTPVQSDSPSSQLLYPTPTDDFGRPAFQTSFSDSARMHACQKTQTRGHFPLLDQTITSGPTHNQNNQPQEPRGQPYHNAYMPPPEQTHGHFPLLDQTSRPTHNQNNQPEERPSTAHSGDACSDSAAIIEPQYMITVPAPGIDGLRFSSRATAPETCDLLYREVFEIQDDDVVEVKSHKEHHVKSLVKALNYKGFMAAPDTRPVGRGKEKTLNAAEKQAWLHWQIGACKSVEIRMAQPNADVNLERRAWEVFDEIVKAHSVGFRLSVLTKDEKSKCSQRIKGALQEIESHAILRQKILDGDNISDFAVNPEDYARRTRVTHYNNAERAAKRKVEKEARERAAAASGQAGSGNTSSGIPTPVPGISHGRRAATSTGAVVRRSMSKKDLKLLKKEAPTGGKTKSGAKGTADDAAPPRDVGTSSTTLPAAAAEDEAGASSGERGRRGRSSANLFSGSSSDYPGMFQPERAQLQSHRTSRPTPSDLGNFFNFTSNWDLSPAMLPAPLGSTGHGISNVTDGVGLSTSGISGGYTFEDALAFPNMQNQLRRGQVAIYPGQRTAASANHGIYGAGSFSQEDQALLNLQNQRHSEEAPGCSDQQVTATHGTYGVVPIGSASSPEENTRKRHRID